MNTINLQNLIQLARKFKFFLVILSFITASIYSYFYFMNEQQNYNIFFKIDYETSANYSFLKKTTDKLKLNKFAPAYDIYFDNFSKIDRMAFFNEFKKNLNNTPLNQISNKDIPDEFNMRYVHKKLLQLLFNDTNAAQFKIKITNNKVDEFKSYINEYLTTNNEIAKSKLLNSIKQDFQEYFNSKNKYTKMIEKEIFNKHINLFKTEIFEILYYLNSLNIQDSDELSELQKSVYLRYLTTKEKLLFKHSTLSFEIINLNNYYNLSLLNIKIDNQDFLDNSKKYIDKLNKIYMKNLDIIQKIFEEDNFKNFNLPNIEQDDISYFNFSRYIEVNEDIKAYLRFQFYDRVIEDYFSNFSVDDEIKFIKFIDIENYRNQLAIYVDTLTLFIIIFIVSAFFYFFILLNYIILFTKNNKVDE